MRSFAGVLACVDEAVGAACAPVGEGACVDNGTCVGCDAGGGAAQATSNAAATADAVRNDFRFMLVPSYLKSAVTDTLITLACPSRPALTNLSVSADRILVSRCVGQGV